MSLESASRVDFDHWHHGHGNGPPTTCVLLWGTWAGVVVQLQSSLRGMVCGGETAFPYHRKQPTKITKSFTNYNNSQRNTYQTQETAPFSADVRRIFFPLQLPPRHSFDAEDKIPKSERSTEETVLAACMFVDERQGHQDVEFRIWWDTVPVTFRSRQSMPYCDVEDAKKQQQQQQQSTKNIRVRACKNTTATSTQHPAQFKN